MSFDAFPDPANTNPISKDYFIEIIKGNVTGTESQFILARNRLLGGSVFETIWDVGGTYTFLSADTALFISSSSASDTDVDVAVSGLDDTYTEVVRTVTTNGQTQVALSGDMFRVHIANVFDATSPIGDLYIAEADTLTGGVPDTASKIKAKIPLSNLDSGLYASDNISHNGFRTVPAGKTLIGIEISDSTKKNQDIEIDFRIKPFGGVYLSLGINWLYQSLAVLPFPVRFTAPEKSEVEFRALSGAVNDSVDLQLEFILIDNTEFEAVALASVSSMQHLGIMT